MRFANIDLNLFFVFDVIYREGNLTRAAEAMSLTQPAVSNALQRLRERLDDPLFVRDGRKMVPTPVAQNMIGPVRQALRQLRVSVEERERFVPVQSERSFAISMSDIASSMLLPDVVARMAEAAPRIRLRCFQVDRPHIATELAAGRLDLAIDIGGLAQTALDGTPLLQDRYVCVLARDHPLAGKDLTMADFLELSHITVSSRRQGAGFVEAALRQRGERLQTHLRLQTYQPAFHVAMNSQMALSAPLTLAQRYDVVVKELPFPIEPLRSFLFWHKSAANDPANIWLRENLVQAAGAFTAEVG